MLAGGTGGTSGQKKPDTWPAQGLWAAGAAEGAEPERKPVGPHSAAGAGAGGAGGAAPGRQPDQERPLWHRTADRVRGGRGEDVCRHH